MGAMQVVGRSGLLALIAVLPVATAGCGGSGESSGVKLARGARAAEDEGGSPSTSTTSGGNGAVDPSTTTAATGGTTATSGAARSTNGGSLDRSVGGASSTPTVAPAPTTPPAPLPPIVTATVASNTWNQVSIAVSVDWRGQTAGSCTGGGAGCGPFTISGTCRGSFDRTITARNAFGQTASARVAGTFADLPVASNAQLTRTSTISATNLGGGNWRFAYSVRNNGAPARIPQLIAVLHRSPYWLVADTFDSNVCLGTGQSYTLNRTTYLPSGTWLYSAQWGTGAGMWASFQDPAPIVYTFTF